MKKLALLMLLTAGFVFAAEEGKGEDEEGKIGPWKWANFAILAIGLGYMIAKNLPPFFTSRSAEIQKGISEAQAIKKDAEQRAAATDARVAALGAEIEKFRGESRDEMQRESDRIRQDTARQIAKMQQQAEADIDSHGKAARRELRTYAAQLAVDLAEQRIRGRLDGATDGVLVDRFVADLKGQSLSNPGSNN
jgi:F-type H+-transporting ATPase subunit b